MSDNFCDALIVAWYKNRGGGGGGGGRADSGNYRGISLLSIA